MRYLSRKSSENTIVTCLFKEFFFFGSTSSIVTQLEWERARSSHGWSFRNRWVRKVGTWICMEFALFTFFFEELKKTKIWIYRAIVVKIMSTFFSLISLWRWSALSRTSKLKGSILVFFKRSTMPPDEVMEPVELLWLAPKLPLDWIKKHS